MPRPTGFTAAAGALRYWERRQAITSNNLANVSTDGFKGERAFAALLGEATPVAQTTTDLRAGALRETRNPLDLALGGDGFFVVQTPKGERLSRGGAMRLDEQRRLVDGDGHAVLGEQGPIVLPRGGRIDVAADGTIGVDGRAVARLRLEAAPKGEALQREGEGLFVPGTTRPPLAPNDRHVRQGMLEESNVNAIGALVDMITVQRAYASVQKAMVTMDGIRGTAATELGKPV